MKVVLDTNVLISGIFWSGTPYHILQAYTAGKFELVVSTDILNEYMEVIRRIDTEGDLAQRWSLYLTEKAILVKDVAVVKISRDPDDDIFINAAVVGKASYLVSGDDDLLSLAGSSPVKMINPSAFLKIVRKDTR